MVVYILFYKYTLNRMKGEIRLILFIYLLLCFICIIAFKTKFGGINNYFVCCTCGLIWVLAMHYNHAINGFQFTCLCGGEAGWGNNISPIKDFINK